MKQQKTGQKAVEGGSIRFSTGNYEFIRQLANASNRTMTGEANWMCRVLTILQKEHSDIFNEISNKLQHEGFK